MLYMSYGSAYEQVRGVNPIVFMLSRAIESQMHRESIQCLCFFSQNILSYIAEDIRERRILRRTGQWCDVQRFF